MNMITAIVIVVAVASITVVLVIGGRRQNMQRPNVARMDQWWRNPLTLFYAKRTVPFFT
jgi:hypothetical protein